MLVVVVLVLGVLTVVMLRAGGTILFPPALFCASWFATLAGAAAAGARFLPISEYASLIYLVGGVAFVLGGTVVLYYLGDAPKGDVAPMRRSEATRHTLDALLILLVAAYPYYFHIALRIAGTSNPALFLPAIRMRMVQVAGNPFGVAGNLNVLAALVASAIVYESDGSVKRRLKAVVAVIMALGYGVLTGSKGVVLLLVTLFFLTQIRAGRVRPVAVFAAAGIVLATFTVGLWAINFHGRSFSNIGAMASRMASMGGNYWLSSVVTFSRIVTKPNSLPSAESIGRFFLETGKSLGFHVHVPSINAKYTVFGTHGENSNTYTIYFSYFKEYGWFGSIVLLAGLGGGLTLVWRRAMAARPVAILFYASFCTAILESIYSENFFLGLNWDVKALIVYGFLYWMLPRYFPAQWRRQGAAAHVPCPGSAMHAVGRR